MSCAKRVTETSAPPKKPKKQLYIAKVNRAKSQRQKTREMWKKPLVGSEHTKQLTLNQSFRNANCPLHSECPVAAAPLPPPDSESKLTPS